MNLLQLRSLHSDFKGARTALIDLSRGVVKFQT